MLAQRDVARQRFLVVAVLVGEVAAAGTDAPVRLA